MLKVQEQKQNYPLPCVLNISLTLYSFKRLLILNTYFIWDKLKLPKTFAKRWEILGPAECPLNAS